MWWVLVTYFSIHSKKMITYPWLCDNHSCLDFYDIWKSSNYAFFEVGSKSNLPKNLMLWPKKQHSEQIKSYCWDLSCSRLDGIPLKSSFLYSFKMCFSFYDFDIYRWVWVFCFLTNLIDLIDFLKFLPIFVELWLVRIRTQRYLFPS